MDNRGNNESLEGWSTFFSVSMGLVFIKAQSVQLRLLRVCVCVPHLGHLCLRDYMGQTHILKYQ